MFGTRSAPDDLPVRPRRPRGRRRTPARPPARNVLRVEPLEVRITPTVTWSGHVDNLWTNPSNWVGGVAPTAGEDLVFPANAERFTSSNDFADGSGFGAISIDGAGYAIDGNGISLSGGLAAGYAAGSSNLDLDAILGGGTVTVAAGGQLNLGGALGGSNGLTLNGGGVLNLIGATVNVYAGKTTVNDGTLQLGKDAGVTAVPGDLVVGDGVGTDLVLLTAPDQIADASAVTLNSSGRLDLNGQDDAIGSLNMTGAAVTTGTGTLTLLGDLTTNMAPVPSTVAGKVALPAGVHTFAVDDPPAMIPVDADISADLSGPGSIVKGGSGRMALSGNNSFDGTTTVAAGILAVAGDNALGNTAAGTTVDNGAVLEFDGNLTLAAEAITLDGAGFGGLGALWVASGSSTIPGVVTLAGDSTIRVDSGARLTIDGQITDGAGVFGVTKDGAGTLALANANPYDGATDIAAGVVQVSNGGALGNGPATVADGAALELSGDITVANPITIAGVGVLGDGALRSTTGSNTLTGGVTLNADPTTIGVDAGGTLAVVAVGVGGTGALDKVGGGALDLDASAVGGFAGNLYVLDGRLAVNADYSGGAAAVFAGGTLAGDGLVGSIDSFGGTVAPGATVGRLSAAGGVTLDAGSTLAVEIDGTAAGSGYDQLASTGGPISLDGVLALGLGFTPAVGDTFRIVDNLGGSAIQGQFLGLPEGATFTQGNVTFQISYAGGDGDDVELTAIAVTYTWTGLGGDANWSNPSNWGGQAPTAGSDLVFPAGGAQGLNVNDLAVGTAFHSITVSGPGYDLNGNDIELTGGFVVAGGADVNMNINVTLAGVQTFDVAAGGSLSYYGAIGGLGYGLTKTGGGTLALTNNYLDNTYTGATTVIDGTLVLGSAHVVIPGDLVVGDGFGAGETVRFDSSNEIDDNARVTLNEGSTLDFNGNSDQFRDLVMQGATITLGGGTVSVLTSITTNPSANNVTPRIMGPGTLDLASDIVVFAIADDVDTDVDLDVSAVVLDGGVIKAGAGTLAFSSWNGYSDGTTVSDGVLAVSNDHALGSGLVTINFPGQLALSGGITVANALRNTSTGTGIASTGGANVLSGAIDLSVNGTIWVDASSRLEISGTIGESNPNLSLTKTGAGTLRLDSANSYSGGTDIQAGTLEVANAWAAGSQGLIYVETGATLLLQAPTFNAPTGGIYMGGAVVQSRIAANDAAAHTLNGNVHLIGNAAFDVLGAGSLTVAANIDGSGTVTLSSSSVGTLILAGSSSYAGRTYVLGGTMQVDGNFASSAELDVQGGTLGGNGTVGRVVATGGAIASGDGPGRLTAGAVDLGAGATLAAHLGGLIAGTEYNQLVTSGPLTLGGGPLQLTLSGFTPAAGDTFTLVDNQGAGAISGTFAGLPEGAAFVSAGSAFQISYVGGDGNDVTLTSIGATSTTLIASASPSVAGEPVTFTATVGTGGAAVPTGVVDFYDGLTWIGSGSLDAGQATFTTSSLALGGHSITAIYAGDSVFTGSTSGALAQGVNPDSTTAVLSASTAGNPSVWGESITFTVLVTADLPGAGTPTGTVQFFADGNPIGAPVALAGGLAVLDFAGLDPGMHTIAATYAGDPSFFGSDSAGLTQDVSAANTTTTVSSPGATVFGQSIDLTATVAVVSPGAGTPTGTVQFFADGDPIGAPVALAGGSATLSVLNLSVGTHAITADYVADSGNFADNSSATYGQDVNQADTATAITSDVAAPVFGQSLTFTATVSAVSPGAGTPTGTVQFYDGGSPMGAPVALSGGLASLTTSALSVATHQITAVYSGDGDFLADTSADFDQPVAAANTFAAVASDVAMPVFGQSITLTATVSAAAPGAGTPTGLVEFFADGNSLGSVALAGGLAALPVASLTVGDHVITVIYAGDVDFVGGSSAGLDQHVDAAATTTIVIGDLPTVFGQPATFAANVSVDAPGAGTPTGTVTFFVDGNPAGIGVVANGVATFSTAGLSVGDHAIDARYDGDGSFLTSTSAATIQTVGQASTMATLTGSINPTVFGQPTTLTTNVTILAPGAGVATGVVTFFDGATPIGNGTLSNGVATLTVADLAVGDHSITAAYSGDADFLGTTSAALVQGVNRADSTATIAAASSAVVGQPLTIDAAVNAVAPGAGVPTGTVTLLDGANPIATLPLDATGQAAFVVADLAPGAHSLMVVFGGDAGFNPAASASADVTVSPAQTTIAVSSSAASAVFGQPMTLTATLGIVAPGAGSPAGTVTFFDGAALLGISSLAGNVAMLTTSSLGLGAHAITAVYGGDAGFDPSTSAAFNQSVAQDGSATTLNAAGATVFGQPASFTATVAAAAPGAGVATGTVTFFDGASPIGTVDLAGGAATLSVTSLSAGTHAITAAYNGDADFAASTSAAVSQSVAQSASALTLAASAASTVAGQSVTFTAIVAAVVPGVGVPTGSVTFYDGSTPLGTVGLVGGTASLATAGLAVGNHTIGAAYSGDAGFASTQATKAQSVTRSTTSAALVASVNAAVIGQPVTFTAYVGVNSPGSGVPTGSVTFYDGASPIGSAALAGNVATFTTSALGVGPHAISAVYGGDARDAGSTTAALAVPVSPAGTATALVASADRVVSGQVVTYAAIVAATIPGAGTPTGVVTFYDGDRVLGDAALVDGQASVSVPMTGVGVYHLVSAVFRGDARFTASLSAPLSPVVSPASSVATLIITPAASGRAGLFTTTVAIAAPGGGTPTGTLTYYVNGRAFATSTVADGQGTLLVPSRRLLNRTFRVRYSGDGEVQGSTSAPVFVSRNVFRGATRPAAQLSARGSHFLRAR